MRDLRHLKRMADYSSCDTSNLNDFLSSIHPEYSAYTYTLLNNHVDKDTLRKCVNEDVLAECGVKNSIDRRRIIDALKGEKNESVRIIISKMLMKVQKSFQNKKYRLHYVLRESMVVNILFCIFFLK